MQSGILTEPQRQAIEMLTLGKSQVAIAEELNVARETVCRWFRLPSFKEALDKSASEVRSQARPRLTSLITTAVDALEDGFNDPTIYPRDKFIMSIKFLELCQKYQIDFNIKTRELQEDRDYQRLQEVTQELLEKKRKEITYLKEEKDE